MRKWLGRIAFALIILAAWQFMEGRAARVRGGDTTWPYGAAAIHAGVGAAGMRERHRPD
jgi:hypothetical protein